MMKKRLALFLVVVMAAISIAACGKSKDTASSKDKDGDEVVEEEEKKTYHFTIWGSSEDVSEENGSWLETRCDMFAAKYPDDEVEFEFAACSDEEMIEKMTEDRDAAPDIFIFSSFQIDQLVEDRLLTRLWGETEEYVLSSNTTSIANLAKYKDKVYGIPVAADPFVLYYDKRVYSQEDMRSLDTILAKGVLSYPLEDETYLQAFYGAQDVVELPQEESAEESEGDAAQGSADSENGDTVQGTEDPKSEDTSQGSEDPKSEDAQGTEDSGNGDTTQETEDPQTGEEVKEGGNDSEEADTALTKESVDAWLEGFRAHPNVVVDADGTAGITGMQNGTVQAAVYDAAAYQQMKDILGENLGVAALPVFTIDGVEKQMGCVAKTWNIGVNPDCENFEMTIALATYLGSADSQQMHYDMSGVTPINLKAVQTLTDVDMIHLIAQIADKENPGWDLPEEEEE